jgi:hypothetical protein
MLAAVAAAGVYLRLWVTPAAMPVVLAAVAFEGTGDDRDLVVHALATTLGPGYRVLVATPGTGSSLRACDESGAQVSVDASVARLGRRQVVSLEVLDCGNGDSVARAQAESADGFSLADAASRAARDIRDGLERRLRQRPLTLPSGTPARPQ